MKGQANSMIVASLTLLVIIGFLGLVSVTIYSNIEDSVDDSLSSTTGQAAQTMNNITAGVYDGYDLAANIPIILAAGMLLAVIIGFGMYVRS